MNIPETIAQELSLGLGQIQNALVLFAEGGTVPFIARYRKEKTGEMNETQLRTLLERHTYLSELEERKAVVLKSIEDQGKLSDALKTSIEACVQKTELEDLYLPFKPKKRTRATVAKEKGLESLAVFIKEQNHPDVPSADLEEEAIRYISKDLGVQSAAEALQGASDILAEESSEKSNLRQFLREFLIKKGAFTSRIREGYPEGTTKFEMYRDYTVSVKDIAPHNMLALRRGEAEGILAFTIEFDLPFVISYLASQEIHTTDTALRAFYETMLADAFERLMRTTLIGEVCHQKKTEADRVSVKTFEANLRELLLSSPAGMKPTLGIDPGFRTGCKVAAVDRTGKLLEYVTIHPHRSEGERNRAAERVKNLIAKHGIELLAIGNGTAGRETDGFIGEILSEIEQKAVKVMVSEAGASVYSASEGAIEEFPDLDLTVRGAISIARRLQDPLAELVKIDPKSIGVGQYQHDVDQKLLKQKLGETIESCVNYVGVDLNLASKELLSFVAGMSPTAARNVIVYRNEHGAFRNRQELLNVPKFGPKTFEQAAGFLRIRNGENPLDNTAVHPESYFIVEKIARSLNTSPERNAEVPDKIKALNLKDLVTENIGEPTLRDIVAELEKPGRDPRAEFRYARFNDEVKEMKDLLPGMELEGVVTNVVNFGAFVDIGVHQDGLVHISQLADRFVDDPKKIVKVGQIVTVRVLEVNEPLKRISLSMKKGKSDGSKPSSKTNKSTRQKPAASVHN